MTIQFETYCWSAVGGAEFTSPSQSSNSVAEDRVLPGYETPLDFNDIGEFINETEIVITSEGSPGFSIKGHHPEKDGLFARLLAAPAFTALGASLTQSSLRGGFSSSYSRGIRIGWEPGGAS